MSARHRIPARTRITAAARYARWLFPRLHLRWQTWRGCVCAVTSTRNCPVHQDGDTAFLALMRLGVHPRHAATDLEAEPPDDWSPAAEYGDPPQFLAAPIYVTGRVPAAPADPPARPVTSKVHHIEVHPVQQWAAAAWERVAATPNQVKGYWTAPDRSDYSDTGWSKREGLDLAVRLAEEALTGFDHIVDYATSGMQARWAS